MSKANQNLNMGCISAMPFVFFFLVAFLSFLIDTLPKDLPQQQYRDIDKAIKYINFKAKNDTLYLESLTPKK